MKQKNILSLIEKFVAFLKKQDEDVINGIISGQLTLKYQIEAKLQNDVATTPLWIPEFVEELYNISSRVECKEVIKLRNLKKNELIAILKYMEISVSKQDNKSKLANKIIENTIGQRKRSDAIIKD